MIRPPQEGRTALAAAAAAGRGAVVTALVKVGQGHFDVNAVDKVPGAVCPRCVRGVFAVCPRGSPRHQRSPLLLPPQAGRSVLHLLASAVVPADSSQRLDRLTAARCLLLGGADPLLECGVRPLLLHCSKDHQPQSKAPPPRTSSLSESATPVQ